MRSFFPPTSGAEVCFNAVDDNENGLLDEGCDVPQGLVQVALSWESDQDDFDLVVADPNGEIATAEAPTALGLSYLRDCPDDDACTEQPFELVFLEDAESFGGKYSVLVRAEVIGGNRSRTPAWLGIRTPEKTVAYELSFTAERQELRLQFDVASPPKKE